MSTDPSSGGLTAKADAAFRLAAERVIEVARRTGTPVIVSDGEGKIVRLSWEEAQERLRRANLDLRGTDRDSTVGDRRMLSSRPPCSPDAH